VGKRRKDAKEIYATESTQCSLSVSPIKERRRREGTGVGNRVALHTQHTMTASFSWLDYTRTRENKPEEHKCELGYGLAAAAVELPAVVDSTQRKRSAIGRPVRFLKTQKKGRGRMRKTIVRVPYHLLLCRTRTIAAQRTIGRSGHVLLWNLDRGEERMAEGFFAGKPLSGVELKKLEGHNCVSASRTQKHVSFFVFRMIQSITFSRRSRAS
jgi:hypothetical protein